MGPSTPPPEILKAEHAWLQTVQQQFIIGDQKFKMLQKSLGLFYDENNILRCKGRISDANLPYVTKFPAVLPKDHHLTLPKRQKLCGTESSCMQTMSPVLMTDSLCTFGIPLWCSHVLMFA